MKTAISSQPNKDVLEAEVPPEILEQFKILNSAIEKNNSLAQDFLLNTSIDDLQKLDFEVAKVSRLLRDLRSAVRKERMKNNTLSEHVARDEQMAEQVNRCYEVLTKNPQFGRAQAVEYLHTIASEHERNLINYEATITKVEETLRSLMDTDKETSSLTQRDLSEHIQRFDEIFSVIASQICNVNEEVERLKDAFLEQQTKIYGRYARNPFEKRKERQKMYDAFSNLKGLDAFPSQNAVLSMSEFLPKQQPSVPTSGSLFGTGISNIGGASGGLFFNNKSTAITTASSFSLFSQSQSQFSKPATSVAPIGFCTTTPSWYGSTGNPVVTSTPSIFGPTLTTTANNLFGTSTPVPAKQLFGGASVSTAAPAATGFGATAIVPAATGFGPVPAATGFGAVPAATGFNTAPAATGFNAAPAATGFNAAPAATGFNTAPAATGFVGFSNPVASNTGGPFNFGTNAAATQPATGLFGNSSASGANFGNTLNSPSSGTLFSGSAPSAPKSLFGAK